MNIVIITLIVAAYLLFNVVVTLICESEQPMNTAFKALMITLGLPIVIVLIVVAVIESIKRG